MATPTKCQTCPIFTQRSTTPPGKKLRPQRKFDIQTELAIICRYCNGESSQHIAQDKHCTPDTVQNILRQYDKPLRNLRDAQLIRRGSHDLAFPQSTEIPQLLTKLGVKKYFRHLIALLLLTDGAAGYRKNRGPYITFTNKAEKLHQIFVDLIFYMFKQQPSAYFKPYWSKAGKKGSQAFYTTYNRRDDTEIILQNLFELSPTYRTKPRRGQTWEQYLRERIHPTLESLIKIELPKQLKIFSLQLAMSTEGSISPMFRPDARFPYPHLLFSCKHPKLQIQWRSFFKKFNIHFEPTREQLESGKLKISLRFLELGGFLDGIPVQKNSHYYGLERNDVLQAILVDRKDFPIDPVLPLKLRHMKLRQKAEKIAQERIKKRKEGGIASQAKTKTV